MSLSSLSLHVCPIASCKCLQSRQRQAFLLGIPSLAWFLIYDWLLNGCLKWTGIHWQNVLTWTFCDSRIIPLIDVASHSWCWQWMKPSLGMRPFIYMLFGGSSGFKPDPTLSPLIGNSKWFCESSTGPISFPVSSLLDDLVQVITSLGFGFTQSECMHTRESQNNPQGRALRATSPYSKPRARLGFRIRILSF